MRIQQSHRLHNSFGLEVRAARYAAPDTVETLEEILVVENPHPESLLIMGEGSNILFTKDYDGLVLRPCMKDIYVLEEYDSEVLVKVGAAVNWDQWVEYALAHGWHGLENLSLIPGAVGSAPIQNIGAYGTELKDHLRGIHAWDLREKKKAEICYKDCHFGYRNSIFKSSQKGRYIITHVIFRLSKIPKLNLSYGNIETAFREAGGKTAEDLRKIIINIRQQKLPEPDTHGNAGSFFKNPVVEQAVFERIIADHPQVPSYPDKTDHRKIPAAWLIEKTGWKGKRKGAVGTWPGQPLVIVNYGGADGKEIFDFSACIIDEVHGKFGISLEREVNVI